jgi:hypothetical protein
MKMAFVNDKAGDRTYDPNSGAELIYKMGDRDGIKTLVFVWKERKIKIVATCEANPDDQHRLHVKWDVLGMQIPPEAENEKNEIIGMLREAFVAFGVRGVRREDDTVIVQFAPSIGVQP